MRRVSGWSFRLTNEGRHSSAAFFVTFTYDSKSVPLSKRKFMTLRKRDCQLYFKRVRKRLGSGLKYYLCGEYGKTYKRPHYHAILFNLNLDQIIDQPSMHEYNMSRLKLDGKSQFKAIGWDHGHVTIGDVNEASIGYTLKYMCKGKTVPAHRNDDRLPEFSIMSKGLGVGYLTYSIWQWHMDRLLDRYYLPLPEGKKIALPRYYKDKLYSPKDKKVIAKHLEKVINNDLVDKKTEYGDGYDQYIVDLKSQQDKKLQRQRQEEKL